MMLLRQRMDKVVVYGAAIWREAINLLGIGLLRGSETTAVQFWYYSPRAFRNNSI